MEGLGIARRQATLLLDTRLLDFEIMTASLPAKAKKKLPYPAAPTN
jgi:hypothetical protein